MPTRVRKVSWQEEFMLRAEFDPNSTYHGTYNLSVAFEFALPLTARAEELLRSTLGRVQARHEAARTRYRRTAGVFQALIDAEPRLRLTVESHAALHARHPEKSPTEIEHLMVDLESRKHFDLNDDHPIRIGLLDCGERFLAIATFHHVASDGTSASVFMRELITSFLGALAGKEVPLPDLERQYSDYADWQSALLSAGQSSADANFWRAKLEGLRVPVPIIGDLPEPHAVRARGAFADMLLPASSAGRLLETCSRLGVSPSSFLTGALMVCVSARSQVDDLVVEQPLANRSQPEFQGIFGYVASAVLVRAKVEQQSSFEALATRVHEEARQAKRHNSTPFSQLVDDLPEVLPHRRKVQLMLNAMPVEKWRGPKSSRNQHVRLRWELCRHLAGPFGVAAHHELGVVWSVPQPQDVTEAMTGYVIFDTSRFSAPWTQAFVAGYQKLIERAAEEPSRTVESLLRAR